MIENNTGFVGKVNVYDKELYIDTNTGAGYDEVINTMKGYIDWYSGKIKFRGYEKEDIRQFIVLTILDGIRRYDPKYEIKLSTFLFVHVKNRMITKFKTETRQSINATYNEQVYKFICKCGDSFVSNKMEAMRMECGKCKIAVDANWIMRPIRINTVPLEQCLTEYDDIDTIDNIKYSPINFFGRLQDIDDVESKLDFNTTMLDNDPITNKIVSLMYNNDYSITDAAQEVGMSCWAASLRLKRLKNKKAVKEFLLD